MRSLATVKKRKPIIVRLSTLLSIISLITAVGCGSWHDEYGEHCKKDGDCGDLLLCNQFGICNCFRNKEEQAFQFYDLDVGACFIRVGGKCSHTFITNTTPIRRQHAHATPFGCIPNGYCKRSWNFRSRLAYCACILGYVSTTAGKQCRRVDHELVGGLPNITITRARILSNNNTITTIAGSLQNQNGLASAANKNGTTTPFVATLLSSNDDDSSNMREVLDEDHYSIKNSETQDSTTPPSSSSSSGVTTTSSLKQLSCNAGSHVWSKFSTIADFLLLFVITIII